MGIKGAEMTTNPTSDAPNPARLIPGLLVALLIANLAGTAYLVHDAHATRDELDGRLRALQHSVREWGYFATAKYEGAGFLLLLEHLQYWAPWLEKSKPGSDDRFFVDERMKDIVETMSFLPDASAQIESAFLAEQSVGGDATTNDELRKWLLIAALSADPPKGKDLLARVLRGKEFAVSLRLRRFAASELLLADKKIAGEILHELLAEKHTNPSQRAGSQTPGLHPKQLFNYIDDYVATGHPEVERTLLRMLTRTEYYETITVQRCVEALGRMKSVMSANRIKALFWQQAPVPGQVPNPLFRRKCMVAVVEALGQDAVPFLKEVDVKEVDAGIRAKLNDYKKQFDFADK
jgi:hypothetical protein